MLDADTKINTLMMALNDAQIRIKVLESELEWLRDRFASAAIENNQSKKRT